MKKSVFFGMVAICLVILFAGTYQPKDAEKATIPIGGMYCEYSAERIQSALIEVDGVKKASVDLSKGMAEVIFNPAVVKLDDLTGVVTEMGYGVGSTQSLAECPGMDKSKGDCTKEGKAAKDCCAKKHKGSI